MVSGFRFWVACKYPVAVSFLALHCYTSWIFDVWSGQMALILFFSIRLFYAWGAVESLKAFQNALGFWERFILVGEFLVLFFFLSRWELDQLLVFFVLGCLALWYYRPFFGVRLRCIPSFKIFWIAFLWVAVLYAGFIFSDRGFFDLFTSEVWIHFLGLYFLVLAITVPFDVRDFRLDSVSLRTLPQLFGVFGSKVFGVLFLMMAELLRFWVMIWEKEKDAMFYIGTSFFTLYVLGFIVFSNERRAGWYYSFGMEFAPVVLILNVFLVDCFPSIW